MQIPYIAMFLNEKDELVMSHFSRADDPLNVSWALGDFDDRGFEEAARQIGGVVLANMAIWHPEQMAKYPDLKVPYDETEDISIIHSLLVKSDKQKTKVHLATIEALMADVLREKPEMATHPLFATWPDRMKSIENSWT